MKSDRVLKTFAALTFDGNAVVAADVPAARASSPEPALDGVASDIATMSNEFHESLHWRYNAPYAVASDHRHWGINE